MIHLLPYGFTKVKNFKKRFWIKIEDEVRGRFSGHRKVCVFSSPNSTLPALVIWTSHESCKVIAHWSIKDRTIKEGGGELLTALERILRRVMNPCSNCCHPVICEFYLGECHGGIRRSVERELSKYKRGGKCSDCGACSEKQAESKCTAKQDQTGEFSCAGDDLWG